MYMYFRLIGGWLEDYLRRDELTAKDPFGANKTRLKQLRSEGWISQIPPWLRSSAFSIRVESINFNFSSQSRYNLFPLPISLSSLEVIYFEKLQKIQIVERCYISVESIQNVFHLSSFYSTWDMNIFLV